MNLFKELGISHSVLMDTDEIGTAEYILNEFIESKRNGFTKKIAYLLDKDVETFSGINTPQKNSTDKKPLNVMWHYTKGKIAADKIDSLKTIVKDLLE